MIKDLCKSALVIGLVMFSAASAFAHAGLATTMPAANSTVAASQPEISLTFSEAIDLKFSGAKLEDSKNIDVPTGPASLAKDDDKILLIPLSTPLSAGDYLVMWHNLSKDGHKIKGSFKFTVKP